MKRIVGRWTTMTWFYVTIFIIIVAVIVLLIHFKSRWLIGDIITWSDDVGNLTGIVTLIISYLLWSSSSKRAAERKLTRLSEPIDTNASIVLVISIGKKAEPDNMLEAVKNYLKKRSSEEKNPADKLSNLIDQGEIFHKDHFKNGPCRINDNFELIYSGEGRILQLNSNQDLPNDDSNIDYIDDFMQAFEAALNEYSKAASIYLFYQGPTVLAFKMAENAANTRKVYLYQYFTSKGNNSSGKSTGVGKPSYRYCGSI